MNSSLTHTADIIGTCGLKSLKKTTLTKSCVELDRSEESIALPVQTLKHCVQLFWGQRQLSLQRLTRKGWKVQVSIMSLKVFILRN